MGGVWRPASGAPGSIGALLDRGVDDAKRAAVIPMVYIYPESRLP